jgi:hypothetical protein
MWLDNHKRLNPVVPKVKIFEIQYPSWLWVNVLMVTGLIGAVFASRKA